MPKIKTPTAKFVILANENRVLRLSTAGTKPAPSSYLTNWRIQWGDGLQLTGTGNPDPTLTHVYEADATVTVIFTVYDRNGRSDTMQGRFIVKGATVVTPPDQPPAGDVITRADITYLGACTPEQAVGVGLQYTNGGFTIRKVGGVTRFILLQQTTTTNCDPVEFTSPGEYDITGALVSGVAFSPTSDGPTAPLYRNWGRNNDSSLYDAWHGVLGQFYDASGTPSNDMYGYGGGGGAAWSCHWRNGRLYASYGAIYGTYHEWGHCFMTLDNPDNGIGPVTSAYGPFNIQINSAAPYPTSPPPHTSRGLRRALYMCDLPDGTMGFGGSTPGSYQRGPDSRGPSLFGGAGEITETTPSGYPTFFNIPDKYVNYYTMSGLVDQMLGTVAPGQPIWAYRMYNYPYVYEPDQTSPAEQISPHENNGIGCFGDTGCNTFGCAVVGTGTKQGIIFVQVLATNHNVQADTTLEQYNGHEVAHEWYATALNNSTCAHGIVSPVAGITGPVSTWYEIEFAIYDRAKAAEVKAGTRVDYTMEPDVRIFPTDDISSNIHLFNGLIGATVCGVAYDPSNRVMYIAVRQQATPLAGWPVIHAFHIGGA